MLLLQIGRSSKEHHDHLHDHILGVARQQLAGAAARAQVEALFDHHAHVLVGQQRAGRAAQRFQHHFHALGVNNLAILCMAGVHELTTSHRVRQRANGLSNVRGVAIQVTVQQELVN